MGLVSAYGSVHFLRLWQKFKEEALFHLGILGFGLIFYLLFVAGLIYLNPNKDTILILIKRTIGIIYSFLCLELSLFYLTAFVNRRSMFEKYIPFIVGITSGMAIALVGMQETNPWFEIILFVEYFLPFIFLVGLVIRISRGAVEILGDKRISPQDRRFIKALLITAIVMFISAIGDLVFFGIFIFITINIWDFVITFSAVIGPFVAILFLSLVRRVFIDIEEADVVHLMNLIS